MEATLRTIEDRYVIYFERRLAHPVEKVWRAITDPARLSHWFPADMDMDFRLGGRIRFSFREGEAPDGEGTISELDPPRVFAYTWDGEVLRFELRPEDSGCLLMFSHTIDDRPATARNAAGWELCFDALEALVDEQPDEGDPDRWMGLHIHYVERFGLDEGTVEEAPDGWTVRFERILPRPVEAVWAKLTEDASSEELEAGGEPPLRFTNGYVPAGAVTEVSAPSCLEYAWRSGDADVGRVRWEIGYDHAGSRVVLIQTVPSALADVRPVALAAWHTHLDQLTEHLLERGQCWPEGRTEELTERYAKTLG
jgi:uncharacterized protein YndB with AHSA1/START domain